MLRIICSLLFLVVIAKAQPSFPTNIVVTPNTNGYVLLTWEPSGETNLAGYNIYVGVTPRTYNTNVFVEGYNTASYTLRGIGTGTFYVALTAVSNIGLECDYSNEIRVVVNNIKPSIPNTLKTGKLLGSFYSSRYPTGPWELIAGTEKLILADEQAQFFRSSVEIVQGPEITLLKGK